MKESERSFYFAKKSDRIEIEISPVSELILCLFSSFGTRSDARPSWSRSLKRKISSSAKRSLKFFFEGDVQLGLGALKFLLDLDPPRTLDSFLNHLGSLSFPDFLKNLLSKLDPGLPLLGEIVLKIRSGATLSEGERAQWEDLSTRYSRDFLEGLEELGEGKFDQKSLGELLKEVWEAFFFAEFPQIFPLLLREAQRVSSWMGLKRMEFLTRIAPGLSFSPDLNEREILVSPTFYGRPYFFTQESRERFLLIFPVFPAEESLDERRKASLSYAFKSLGDPSRMEIIKLLSKKPMYAMEISRALSLSHPTVLHHLASLRAAGFVQSELREGNNYYWLVPGRWEELSREFLEFLTRP